jgi:hypothetical protein
VIQVGTALVLILLFCWFFGGLIIEVVGSRTKGSRAAQAAWAEAKEREEVERKRAQRAQNVAKYGEATVAKWERDAQANRARDAQEYAERKAALAARPWRQRDRAVQPFLGVLAAYTVLSLIVAACFRMPLWPPWYLIGFYAIAGGMGIIPALVSYFDKAGFSPSEPRPNGRIARARGALYAGAFVGMMIMGFLLLLLIPVILLGLTGGTYEAGSCTKGSPWNC